MYEMFCVLCIYVYEHFAFLYWWDGFLCQDVKDIKSCQFILTMSSYQLQSTTKVGSFPGVSLGAGQNWVLFSRVTMFIVGYECLAKVILPVSLHHVIPAMQMTAYWEQGENVFVCLFLINPVFIPNTSSLLSLN